MTDEVSREGGGVPMALGARFPGSRPILPGRSGAGSRGMDPAAENRHRPARRRGLSGSGLDRGRPYPLQSYQLVPVPWSTARGTSRVRAPSIS